jgi:hypothetical protein
MKVISTTPHGLRVVDVQTLSEDDIRRKPSDHRRRINHAGKVVSVREILEPQGEFSGYANLYKYEVTVFDPETLKQEVFVDISVCESNIAKTFTTYGVDAAEDTIRAWRKWLVTFKAAEKANLAAEAAKKNYLLGLEIDRNKILHAPNKGGKYKFVRGVKIPLGTVGTLFWYGTGKYGESWGIALSDAKDSTGRYTDVVFTKPSNLERVIDAAVQSELDEIAAKKAKVASVGEDAWVGQYAADILKYAAEWSVPMDAMTARLLEIADEMDAVAADFDKKAEDSLNAARSLGDYCDSYTKYTRQGVDSHTLAAASYRVKATDALALKERIPLAVKHIDAAASVTT